MAPFIKTPKKNWKNFKSDTVIWPKVKENLYHDAPKKNTVKTQEQIG